MYLNAKYFEKQILIIWTLDLKQICDYYISDIQESDKNLILPLKITQMFDQIWKPMEDIKCL